MKYPLTSLQINKLIEHGLTNDKKPCKNNQINGMQHVDL